MLDKHTAELIAAGEVVERPASVVKELTENAIDAGATAVSVSVERGGIAMIQIADNGCGIEAEYIPTAFIRHATSKLEKEEDLESIHTLGFRGEALASVASVSRIELLTKTDADEYAYLYRISGGEEQGIEPAARPVGTTITVRDLFYNTPARMKFLKKDTSEGNYVADVVTQLALSHPEVSFKFVRDGKPQFQTPGDGKLLGAAYAVLSRDFAKDLVPVEHTAGSYTVRGLVTPPKSARASRAMQYFFINGRFVKNRTMMAALEAAYKGVMMQGKFPGCVLSIEMPPQLVDVNVHPAKTEVRFAREKDVFDAVYQSVKCVLITPQSTEKVFSFGGAERAFPADEKAPDAAAKKEPSESAPAEEPAAAPAQITIGASIRKYDDTYLTEQRNNMKIKGDELGVTIDFTDSKADQTTQNNNIDMYITKEYNALAINMQERSAADVVIEKAKNANIPVVFFNTEPFEEAMAMWDKVYYVGAKAEESGLMQGKAMVDYWNSHPEADKNGDGIVQYVIIMGEPGHQDAELRSEYCVKAMTDAGLQVEEVAKDTAMWDRVKGQDKMATFLAAHDNIEAVFCNNDDMALGAIEALKAQGYFTGDKYMPVFGVDATEPGKEAIIEGTMLATSLNDAKNQGFAVVQLCDLLAKGETPTSESLGYEMDGQYVWIPYVAVSKENVDQFS